MIKIDGIDLRDYGLKALDDYIEGSSHEFNDTLEQGPNMEGLIKVNESLEGRRLEIVFEKIQRTHKEIELLVRQLNNLFFDAWGYRKQVKIELDHWQGLYIMGEIEEPINANRLRGLGQYKIRFRSLQPFRTSNETKSALIEAGTNNITWGSTDVTFADPYTFAYESSLSPINNMIVLDPISRNVYPIIEVEGSATSLKFTANGKSFTLPSFTNSKWIIKRFIAYKNGVETYVPSYDFFLQSGTNKVVITGTDATVKIKISYEERYI